jgi:ubiquinone/menaquinone biosynthesis C-methylase UbiE/glycosyltransferase involved in cell wall biosynthesis
MKRKDGKASGQTDPLVSIVLAVRDSEKESQAVTACLNSITGQTYTKTETLLITDAMESLRAQVKDVPGIRIIPAGPGKSSSRNLGTTAAKGEYVLHVDSNMKLDPEVIQACVDVCRVGADAVIIHERRNLKTGGFWTRCKALEKKVYVGDDSIEASRFMDRQLLDLIAGFDVELDPIDEGDVQAKLDERGVKRTFIEPVIELTDEIRLRESVRSKYARGRIAPLFNVKHPDCPQLKVTKRLRRYVKKAGVLAPHPVLMAGLMVLKTGEAAAFWWGSHRLSQEEKETLRSWKNRMVFNAEASTYQNSFYEETLGAQYVDCVEKAAVLREFKRRGLLTSDELSFLDIGMGGGRWSRLLLTENEKARVTGIDNSKEMVEQAARDLTVFSGRFESCVGDMESMPFADNVFDAAICFRSFKYANRPDAALKEINRVLKPGAILVVEAPNPNAIVLLVSWISRTVLAWRNKGVSGYFARITILRPGQLIELAEQAAFSVESHRYLFAVPSTIMVKIKHAWAVNVLAGPDKLGSNRAFGRSILLTARSVKS